MAALEHARTSRALVVVLVVAVAGCGGRSADPAPDRSASPAAKTETFEFPSYLDQTYTDGTISLRYPKGWSTNTTRTFGDVVSNTTGRFGAFVGIRYLPSREWRTHGEFADAAKRALRPPDGDGIVTRYTQAARLGGRHGAEALIVWEIDGRPSAVMRLFGVELASGKVALIIFATENDERHAGTFAWIKKSIAWE